MGVVAFGFAFVLKNLAICHARARMAITR
jgi:hypothetical protein